MKLVDLVPIKEIDVNDPALMRARAARDQMNQMKSNPRIGFDQVLDLRDEKQDLERQISNLYREMESDPDVEAEGGEVADQYGDTLNRLEARLYKINKQIASYDMSEGEDEDDEQDMADVKADIDSMMNESEDKWNAIDVSRKAEKEISNKEWNARTTKKLDMLIALNKAGKFKKDFNDERLQGWVDQNYSWEKLSKQFKLNEMYNRGTVSLDGKEVDTSSIEMGGLDAMRKYGPDDGGPDTYIEYATFTDGTELSDIQKDKFQDEYPDLTYEKAMEQMYQQEGSCGYGEDGKLGDKPAGPDLIRKAIKNEIKRLHENGDKGFQAARKLIDQLRAKTYRSFSDDDLDAFSKEMALHFIDNTAAEAAIMMRSAKMKGNDYKPGTTDELPFE